MKVSIVSKSDSTIKAAACEIGSLYTNKNGTLVLRVDDDNYDYPFVHMNADGSHPFQIVEYFEDDRFTYVGELKFA